MLIWRTLRVWESMCCMYCPWRDISHHCLNESDLCVKLYRAALVFCFVLAFSSSYLNHVYVTQLSWFICISMGKVSSSTPEIRFIHLIHGFASLSFNKPYLQPQKLSRIFFSKQHISAYMIWILMYVLVYAFTLILQKCLVF